LSFGQKKKKWDCFLFSSSITDFLKLTHFTTAFSSAFWLIIFMKGISTVAKYMYLLQDKVVVIVPAIIGGKWVLTLGVLLSSHRMHVVMEKKKIYLFS